MSVSDLPTNTFTTRDAGSHTHDYPVQLYSCNTLGGGKMVSDLQNNQDQIRRTRSAGNHYHSFQLNTGTQTELDFRRYEGYVLVTFTTDVYVKSNRPRIYQEPESETTIVETPNETTIFVGEA